MADEIINKVAKSGLITIDLEDWYAPGPRIVFDLKDNLWQGVALKEKEYRTFLKEHDWSTYQDAHVAVTCSADAIIPTWAYMLLTSYLEPVAASITFGTLEDVETTLYRQKFAEINPKEYQDARVVIKGCSDKPVPTAAYVELTAMLKPYVRSMMYGEPCSTVPVYKRPKGS